MGTHPIFESDFDCLTEILKNITEAEEHENENQDNTKDGQKAAAALDKVTDHVEEMEMEASTANIENLLKANHKDKPVAEEIKIKKADIDLIVKEMECKRQAAQRALVDAGGDLRAALVSLINN